MSRLQRERVSIFSTKAEFIVHQGNCYKPNRLEKKLARMFCGGKIHVPPEFPGIYSKPIGDKPAVVILYSKSENNEPGKSPSWSWKINPDDTRENRKKWFLETLEAFIREYKPSSIAINSYFSGENRKEYEKILLDLSTEYGVQFFLHRC